MTAKRSISSTTTLVLLAGTLSGPSSAEGRTFGAGHLVPARSAHAGAARAVSEEPTSPFASAATVMPFVENGVVHVYAAPGRVTDMQLQPGEGLVAVASGDTARWVIGDTSSGSGTGKTVHVLVKPVAVGLSTNLVITTDRRTYHLTLASGSGAYVASLSWIYPQDALIALKPAPVGEPTAAPPPIASAPDVEHFHFDYAISGDQPAWRPLRAFDDGQQTFIEFPPALAVGEAPPLFLIGAKGEAQLVNYRQRGRYYVVDRIFEAAELRLGTKHPVVVRIARVSSSIPTMHAAARAS